MRFFAKFDRIEFLEMCFFDREWAWTLAETAVSWAETVFPLAETVSHLGETAFPLAETVFPLAEIVIPLIETVSPLAEIEFPLAGTVFPLAETVFPLREAALCTWTFGTCLLGARKNFRFSEHVCSGPEKRVVALRSFCITKLHLKMSIWSNQKSNFFNEKNCLPRKLGYPTPLSHKLVSPPKPPHPHKILQRKWNLIFWGQCTIKYYIPASSPKRQIWVNRLKGCDLIFAKTRIKFDSNLIKKSNSIFSHDAYNLKWSTFFMKCSKFDQLLFQKMYIFCIKWKNVLKNVFACHFSWKKLTFAGMRPRLIFRECIMFFIHFSSKLHRESPEHCARRVRIMNCRNGGGHF